MNRVISLIAFTTLLVFQSCISENAKLYNSKPDNTPGERTIQVTSVYDNIDGKIIFNLKKNVVLETVPAEKHDWTEIAVTVSLDKYEFLKNELKAGRILKDKNGRDIGQVLETQRIWESNKDGSHTFGILTGYIHTSNIDQNSILENIISDSCMQKETCTLPDLENLLSRYDFVNYQFDSLMSRLDFYKEEYSQLNGIVEFVLEDSWLSDPGADRLSLLFLHDTLISIIHKRPLTVPNINARTAKLQEGRRLIFLDPNKKELFEQLVKFKIEFYNYMINN